MKKTFILLYILICVVAAEAAEWSFGGGYMYFDRAAAHWDDNSIMLIIGREDYSSVYEMTPVTNPDSRLSPTGEWWYTALPSSGWGDATYMAVIGANKVWR